MAAMRARIKKNDTVMVIAGRERGKTGKVLRVLPAKDRALIERLNLVKRHHEAARRAEPARASSRRKRRSTSRTSCSCATSCNAPVRMGKRAARRRPQRARVPPLRRPAGPVITMARLRERYRTRGRARSS